MHGSIYMQTTFTHLSKQHLHTIYSLYTYSIYIYIHIIIYKLKFIKIHKNKTFQASTYPIPSSPMINVGSLKVSVTSTLM